MSSEVEASLQDHIRSWHEDGSPWDRWVEMYETARASFANFIGASPEEVAIVSSASAGISSVASALDFGKRCRVVMGEFEFPTMGQIWLAQTRRGAEIQFVPEQENRISKEDYSHQIDDRTLIVPLTRICFMNGFRGDVTGVTRLAHENGALVMLDDYQDCGTRPIDVKKMEVDFYVSGALKYLLASSGIAFLYVRKDLIESLTPTVTGWFAQTNPFAFDVKHFNPAGNARRFEGGSPPVSLAYAVQASLGLLKELGPDKIAAHVRALTQALLKRAHELGIKSKTSPDSDGPLVVLEMKNAEEMVKRLAAAGIVASNRWNGLRISFHAYNRLDDIDAVIQALQKNMDLVVTEGMQ